MFDKNIFEKAKDMIRNVTKFQKQSKQNAVYVERNKFIKDSCYKEGQFCYNHTYSMDAAEENA